MLILPLPTHHPYIHLPNLLVSRWEAQAMLLLFMETLATLCMPILPLCNLWSCQEMVGTTTPPYLHPKLPLRHLRQTLQNGRHSCLTCGPPLRCLIALSLSNPHLPW
jgi:hypothetical protein